jgi:hypothetical protein
MRRDLRRGQVRKPGRRIAPDVEELESRRLLAAGGLFDLTISASLGPAVDLLREQTSASAVNVPHAANVSLVAPAAPRLPAATAATLPPSVAGLDRTAEALGQLAFSRLEQQATVRTEFLTRAPEQSIAQPVAAVVLIEVHTEPVVVNLGSVRAVSGTPPSVGQAALPVAVSPSNSVVESTVPVVTPVVFGPVQAVVMSPETPAAPPAAGTSIAAGAESSGGVVVPASSAVVSAVRAATPATSVPRAGPVTPVAVLPSAPSTVQVVGSGAPATVNGSASPVAAAAAPAPVLPRGPESGGGNAPEAATWPPEGSGAGTTEVRTVGSSGAAAAEPGPSAWDGVREAAFIEPVWDNLVGMVAPRSSEQLVEHAASWLTSMAGAAALGMVLGAAWVDQPADVVSRRRQFFRQL